MKVGDLIKVRECGMSGWSDFDCECFFCRGNSNRVGLVLSLAPGGWHASFDCGERFLTLRDEASGYITIISRQGEKHEVDTRLTGPALTFES